MILTISLITKTEQNSILNAVDKIGNHFISSVRKKNSVLFTTARKFKGLEADVIILVDIDELNFVNEENRRLFYVGSSRAKHNLDIVFVGSSEEFNSMADVINDKKMPNTMISVAIGLSVKPLKA